MSERLSWEEIASRYPNEWVLLHQVEPRTTERKVKSGVVLYHHRKRKAVYSWGKT